MRPRAGWQRWRRTPTGRRASFLLGWLLVLASPAVGVLPGPGGIFVFAGGAMLILQSSIAAKRCYVRLERRWPRLGDWSNRALRRHRVRRRRIAATHAAD